jgi:aminopeptidase N
MKKFIKWFSIIIGSLILIVTVTVAAIFISHDRYGFYFSGGKISDLQQNYDAVFYDLNLEVISEGEMIKGFVNVGIKSLVDDFNTLELELIDNFEISRVELGGDPLNFEHNDDKLVISLEEPIEKNQYAEVSIHYSGQPLEAIRPPWIGGFNWSKDKNEDDWIGVSCQGEGGKVWFPCKTHPSDEPDSVAINITVPKPYFCASNGILENVSEPKEGYTTYHWFTRYPTNNYNISINIAKYDIIEKTYTSISGNEVPVIYYYLNDPVERADSLVEMAIDMLKTLEKYYGEYPFAKEKFK